MERSPAVLKSYLDFALDAVWQAGRLTLSHFQTRLDVEHKGDNSPVTIADKEAEKLLRRMIEQYFPDDGIIGEEFGTKESRSGMTWAVDPIDGTKSFICGVPFYSNLLALIDENGRSIVGAANFPALNETIYAAQGLGAHWNGRRAQVNTNNRLDKAVLLASEITTGYNAAHQARFQKLLNSTYIHRTWGDAYGYLLVATGRADIMLDPIMKIWDCGALQVILEEAGGTFTDWNGLPTIYAPQTIATNGVLFEQVIAITRD